MLAAVWTDYNKMELRELPTPEIGADDVLVRVMAAGVCITDLHVYSGQFAYGRPPHVLGHEIAGCVESVGANVNRWKKGDRVTVETSIGCGRCRFCRSGQRHLCPELTEIGFSPNPGGYAQFVRVPEDNLVRIPDGVSYEEAGIVESVVCPIAALMRLKVTFGETAAVYGVGPAGLAFIQGLKALGAGKVIAVARDDFRLDRAMRFGADVVVNARSEDALKRIREETDGLGADIVCEAAGAPSTIEEAFQAVRSAGRVILYGIPGDSERVQLPVSTAIMKQLSIYGAAGNPNAWEPLLSAVARGKVNLKDMITHRFPLRKIDEAFAAVRDKRQNAIKAVILPWEGEEQA